MSRSSRRSVRIAVVAAAALIAASCSSFVSGDTTTEAPTTSITPTTTIVDGVELAIVGCDDAPEAFDLLCDVYRVVHREYVDPIDDAVLVSGAIEALQEFGDAHDGNTPSSTLAPGDLVCAVPTDDFADVCEAFAAERLDGLAGDAELVAIAVRGMLAGLDDPATVYLDPGALDRLNEDQSGEVEGIGALVWAVEDDEPCGTLTDSCRMTIASVIPGSPAEQSGIRAGDQVVAVDGESVDGWTLDEAVAAVRGPAGTEVRLGIDRDAESLEVVVTRAAILVPALESEMKADGVGYIRLGYFPSNTSEQFGPALEELVAAGANTIIFDLQGNPGGSLQAAVYVASQFLADGTVVRTESPDRDSEYPVLPGGVAVDESVVVYVLVDGGSASASEVVSGVLQETGRATVVGEATFGKNTVQQQFSLPEGGAVKVTTARWVTPGGLDFGKDGIQPDVPVDIPADAGADYLVEWVLDYLRVVPVP